MSAAARGGAAGSITCEQDRKSYSCPDARKQDQPPIEVQGLLIDGPTVVSLKRQIQAVEREIRLRKQLYPQRVAVRRMSAKKAAEELAAMEAVAATLRDLIGARP